MGRNIAILGLGLSLFAAGVAQADSYINGVAVDCLPELGILQLIPNNYNVGYDNQTAFLKSKEKQESLREQKHVFTELNEKTYSTQCVLYGKKIDVLFEPDGCGTRRYNRRLSPDWGSELVCIPSVVTLSIDGKKIIDRLRVQRNIDAALVDQLTVNVEIDGEFVVLVTYHHEPEDDFDSGSGKINYGQLMGELYIKADFEKDFVINNKNFWGDENS